MKKFSTIALLIAVSFPAMHAMPAFADEVRLPAHSKCSFLPNAPDRHLVVKGDTLWDISGKFLQNPWCWPEVWGMNREEIHNPHWIYPGQIVYFDRVNGRLRLGNSIDGNGNGGSGNGRLGPHIRSQGLDGDAIPSIPANVIEPFLTHPLVIEKDALASAPRIVAAQEGRVYLAKGEKAYVRGNLQDGTSFQVFRPGEALKDPETKAILAYEAIFVGDLKLDRKGKAANEADTFIVVNSTEEMGVGDRLKPTPPSPILNYVPHPPSQNIDARVVSVYGGVAQAGQNQVISINRGAKSGLDLGTVLELSRTGKTIVDPTDKKSAVLLPAENYGTLFIFRVFDNISYGLIMQVKQTVEVGDSAISPE